MFLLEVNKKGYYETTELTVEEIFKLLGNDFIIEKTELQPNKYSSKDIITLSGEFGLDKFPFHTDGANRLIPPKWIILKYEGLLSSDCATILYDSENLTINPQYTKILYEELYLITKTQNPFLTTIINKQLLLEPIFRWNNLIMKKALNISNICFDNIIDNQTIRINWTKNKILVLDNWRILHSRERVNESEEHTRKFTRYNLTKIQN